MKRQRIALHAQQRMYTLAGEADDEDELDGAEDDFLAEEAGLGIPGISSPAGARVPSKQAQWTGRALRCTPPGG